MNNKLIKNYTVSFDLQSRNLLSAIHGLKGSQKLLLEESTNTTITINNHSLKVIISGDRDNVFKAEKEISQILSDVYFTLDIHSNLMGAIIGKKSADIGKIRSRTDAQILTSPPNESPNRTLEIFGKSKASVENARKMILDVIEKKIDKDFNRDRLNCFRTDQIYRGSHLNAEYISDQLSPSPQLFFIDFHGELNDNEEIYEPIHADDNEVCLNVVHKNGGVLAPFEGFLYRAKVLDLQRESDDIKLVVEFVDFGNISRVSFFKCKPLVAKHLYPRRATPCQLANVKQDTVYVKNPLPVFNRVLNNNAIIEEVETGQTHECADLVPIKIKISGVGDLGDHLIQRGVSEMWNDPFSPHLTIPDNKIGTMDVPYIRSGMGECVSMQVRLSDQYRQEYIVGQNFKDDLIDSLDVAYECGKTVLKALHYDDLDKTTLKFTLNDKIPHGGPSHGAAFTILMISECLKLGIPCGKIITGTIDKNGKIGKVGGLREKLLTSKSHNKTQFYVPKANYAEAKSIEVSGLQVIPVDNISDLMTEIFQISL